MKNGMRNLYRKPVSWRQCVLLRRRTFPCVRMRHEEFVGQFLQFHRTCSLVLPWWKTLSLSNAVCFFLNWSNKLWQYSMVVLPFKASWCGYRVNPKNISLWLWWLVPAFAFLGAEAETLFRLILGVQCAGVTSKVKKRLKNWSGLRLNNAKFSEVVLRLCFWSIVSKRGTHVAGYLLIILKWIFKIKSTEQFGITMAPKITRSFNLLTANTIMWNFSFFFWVSDFN